MSGMNDLNEGARLFSEKKKACIKFLDKAISLTKEYEASFPPPEEKPAEPAGTTLMIGASAGKEAPRTRTRIFEDIQKKLESDKLKILVAGQFKQGKSTLINALLGEEVLPAYSTPCTAVITEIAYEPDKKAIIYFKKQIGELPTGISPKAKAHIAGRKENIPELTIQSENLGEELEEYLVIPDDEDKEQRDSVAESPYACCQLKWPLELCRNEVEIIDSPGLNEATARDTTTYTYVPQADMILHVLNANQLFGKPDKEFIDKVQAAGCAGILFLVNRFDQLNTEKDRERVRNRALKELVDYTDHGPGGIFFISSYKALNGRMENDENLYAESGFGRFEKKMAEIIAKDRVKIKLGGGIDAANSELATIVQTYLPELREKMNQNVTELQKKYDDAQGEFRKLDDRKDRIERTIEKGLGNIQKMLKTELRIFFRDFAADSITIYTDDCPINIEFFNKRSSTEAAIQQLSAAVMDGLTSELSEFLTRKQEEIQAIIDEMVETIKEQLNDFNEILASIRADMDMGDKNLNVKNINVEGFGVDEMLGEAIGGALLGGAAGAGAAWLGAQFFAFLAGPVGWGLAIAAALGSALVALLSSTSAEDKVRQEFVREASKRIRHDSDEWAEKLSAELAGKINENKIALMESLNRKIAETKNPILEAIELLKNNQGDLEEKKKELAEFQQKFATLYDEGKALRSSL